MPKRAITQLFLERISPPKAGRVEYWDTAQPGLCLRVSASGAKSWACMYRVSGKQVRETLGTIAEIPRVADARALAEASIEKAKGGVHPIAERQAEAKRLAMNTVNAAAKKWLAACKLKPKTIKGYKQIFDHDVLPRWGARPLAEITKADVLELLNDKATRRDRRRDGATGSPVQANRVLTRLRTFFGWCVANDLIARDPSAGVRRPLPKEEARDRVLSDDELRAFSAATAKIDPVAGGLFRMLLVTAQRRDEVAGMRRSEIDEAARQWVIPAARTKNGREHVVALNDFALKVIAAAASGDVVFPPGAGRAGIDFARTKARLDAEMGEALKEPFVLHDLRRTATSLMARLGIEPHVADRVLNHVAGTIHGVARTYNRFDYLEERRLALEALGRFVSGLVEERLPGKVAEARVKLWLRAERARGEAEAAGNVVPFDAARAAS
jgi:integrase